MNDIIFKIKSPVAIFHLKKKIKLPSSPFNRTFCFQSVLNLSLFLFKNILNKTNQYYVFYILLKLKEDNKLSKLFNFFTII